MLCVLFVAVNWSDSFSGKKDRPRWRGGLVGFRGSALPGQLAPRDLFPRDAVYNAPYLKALSRIGFSSRRSLPVDACPLPPISMNDAYQLWTSARGAQT